MHRFFPRAELFRKIISIGRRDTGFKLDEIADFLSVRRCGEISASRIRKLSIEPIAVHLVVEGPIKWTEHSD